MSFLDEFRSALRAGVPLLCVQSQDPASVISQVKSLVDDKSNTELYKSPLISWNISAGLLAHNRPAGVDAIAEMGAGVDKWDPSKCTDPQLMLRLAQKLRPKSIVFMHNGHRLIGNKTVAEAMIGQAIWNLRDEFKKNSRTLVILAPDVELPPELVQDILVIDEPLPSTEEIRKQLLKLHEVTELPAPEEVVMVKAVEAVRGLSSFAAEQAIAMSLTQNGLDLEKLWIRKRHQVEQTPGLTIYQGKETFADIEGVESAKNFLTQIFNGKDAPTVLVFIDEIEKMFAGLEGDMNGIAQNQHQEFLRWTQDRQVLAMMLVGHPGCSKSFLAKCTAGQFKVPMVELNIDALKGGIVGVTGSQTRNAFKTISAIGKPMIMASSNSLGNLPSELKRRFKQGTWFFDLPSAAERHAVWNLYTKKYELKYKDRPDDTNWTPDEIETCCRNSWRFSKSLIDASKYIVPIAKADPEKIDLLKSQANKKFLSASFPGPYSSEGYEVVKDAVRKIITSGGENIGSA